MIHKILIANRGEIVDRIIKTCKRIGVKTVVVYSEADKNAPYLKKSDESYFIGSSLPAKSYLNIDRLISVLLESHADAVHPGYGFLSENASFCQAVNDCGKIWLGPTAQSLTHIESKCYCREMANENNVPVSPGTISAIQKKQEIFDAIKKTGFPLAFKLDKGGGGKGINIVSEDVGKEKILNIYQSMISIGQAAFASGDVYIEKLIEHPRHIEIQFAADKSGNIVCLGERECSIQRRFQKIIEESPSPVVTSEERRRLYMYTKKMVSALGYEGIGTIEYLRDTQGNYYFMEINARIQVEHAVTEMVTDVDLVELQIRIANGEKLPFTQNDIHLDGHSIECRIYAEDPVNFMPSPGKITSLQLPGDDNGMDLRIDHALQEGTVVSPFYDPMLAKIIVKGKSRLEAINKMTRFLPQINIEGPKTNISLDLKIMNSSVFRSGNFDTSFIAQNIHKGGEIKNEI